MAGAWRVWCWWLMSTLFIGMAATNSDAPLGATCWACEYDHTDETCKLKPRYLPPLAVIDSFCSDVRNSKNVVRPLCKAFPGGYKIMCERPLEPRLIRCRSQVCLAEPERQTGSEGSGATSPRNSHHAQGFLLLLLAHLSVGVATWVMTTTTT